MRETIKCVLGGLLILQKYPFGIEAHEGIIIVGPCKKDAVEKEDQAALENESWHYDEEHEAYAIYC